MTRLFDCLEKRKVMYSARVKEGEVRDGAQAYVELGRLDDALDMFSKIDDNDGMKTVLMEARKIGDVFIVKRAVGLLKMEVGADFWREIAEEAKNKEKHASAARAFAEAGDEEDAAAMRERALSVAEETKQDGDE
ncbi:hypothetical protein ACFL1X_04595 [Candidatus Hydrogenedentota bacterium]